MAQRRMVSMRSRIWSADAFGSGGAPPVRRRSLRVKPCGWPVRWLQAPTRPLSSFRSAARAWRLTGGAADGVVAIADLVSGGLRERRAAAGPAQVVVDDAVRLAGAVDPGPDQAVELLSQGGEGLAAHRRRGGGCLGRW